MAMFVFLYQNGLLLDAPESEVVWMITQTAAGEYEERELADWVRSRTRTQESVD